MTNTGLDCLSGGLPWISQNRRAEEIFAHELGHALGLGHSCGDADSPPCASNPVFNDALMRAFVHGDNRGAALNSDDRAGILFLYGDGLIFADGLSRETPRRGSEAKPQIRILSTRNRKGEKQI